MKKLLLAMAACLVAATSMAQPMSQGPHGPGMERGHLVRPGHRYEHRRVWVPAHRDHGRYVRGHYVRR